MKFSLWLIGLTSGFYLLLPACTGVPNGPGATPGQGITPGTSSPSSPSSAGACAFGSAYPDGCAAAPAGTPPYPSLLRSYGSHRPPWNVAGVDYRVGIGAGVVLKSPTTLASANVSVSNGMVRCTNLGSVTWDSIDFTGYTIYNGSDGCASITITNSKFACPASWRASAPFAFISDQLGARFTIKYNEFYGDNCGQWPNNMSDPVSVGDVVFQYNLMRHFNERHLSPGGNVDYRFNLIDQPLTQAGAHENFLQFGGGDIGNVVVKFNTTYHTAVNGAEGFQFYTNSAGTIASVAFTNNTMIARPANGQTTMSFMVHGNCHSGSDCSSTITPFRGAAVNANNYFDASGAYGVFYNGSFTIPSSPFQSSGNIDMNTGALITP